MLGQHQWWLDTSLLRTRPPDTEHDKYGGLEQGLGLPSLILSYMLKNRRTSWLWFTSIRSPNPGPLPLFGPVTTCAKSQHICKAFPTSSISVGSPSQITLCLEGEINVSDLIYQVVCNIVLLVFTDTQLLLFRILTFKKKNWVMSILLPWRFGLVSYSQMWQL